MIVFENVARDLALAMTRADPSSFLEMFASDGVLLDGGREFLRADLSAWFESNVLLPAATVEQLPTLSSRRRVLWRWTSYPFHDERVQFNTGVRGRLGPAGVQRLVIVGDLAKHPARPWTAAGFISLVAPARHRQASVSQ